MDSSEFLRLIDSISRDRGLDKEMIIEDIEKALLQAAQKRFDAEGEFTLSIDRETGEITSGHVPPGSVVVSGNLPAKDGSHSLYCAVIVKKVDAKTRAKVGINELLRDI